MSAPAYKCPFKSNSGAGITCENVACGAYNLKEEDCNIILYFRKRVKMQGVFDVKEISGDQTQHSSSSSSSSSSSFSSSSSSSSSSSFSSSSSSSSSSSFSSSSSSFSSSSTSGYGPNP